MFRSKGGGGGSSSSGADALVAFVTVAVAFVTASPAERASGADSVATSIAAASAPAAALDFMTGVGNDLSVVGAAMEPSTLLAPSPSPTFSEAVLNAIFASATSNETSSSSSPPPPAPPGWAEMLAYFNGSEIAVYEHFRPPMRILARILPPLWWSVGIGGNLASMLVWLQPLMRHSSGVYLAALALTDVGFLAMNVVYEMHFAAAAESAATTAATAATSGAGGALLNVHGLCEAFSVLYLTLQYASPALVLGFTVERYLSVCHPFRFAESSAAAGGRARCAARCVAALLASCLALAGVQGYLWTVGEDGVCNLRDGGTLLFEGWTWFTEALVFALLPLAVLVLNVRVLAVARRLSRAERRPSPLAAAGAAAASGGSSRSIDRRSTTALLLGVSFYQIFTVLPSTIVYSLYAYFKRPDTIDAEAAMSAAAAAAEAATGSRPVPSTAASVMLAAVAADAAWQRHFDFMFAKFVAQQIGMSHYAANFFIYVLTGKMFRQQLYDLAVRRACGAASRVLRSGSSKLVSSFSTARTSLATAVSSAAVVAEAAQRRKSAAAAPAAVMSSSPCCGGDAAFGAEALLLSPGHEAAAAAAAIGAVADCRLTLVPLLTPPSPRSANFGVMVAVADDDAAAATAAAGTEDEDGSGSDGAPERCGLLERRFGGGGRFDVP